MSSVDIKSKVFELEKFIYQNFEKYRKGFLILFLVLLLIGILVVLYLNIASINDLNPLFSDRELLVNPIVLYNSVNFASFKGSLQSVVPTIFELGPFVTNGRRYFYKYDYTINSEGTNRTTKQGDYYHFTDNIVSGTVIDVSIPLPLITEFPTRTFVLESITRTIGYSNIDYISGTTESTTLTNNEFIVNITSTNTITLNYTIDKNIYYYKDVVV